MDSLPLSHQGSPSLELSRLPIALKIKFENLKLMGFLWPGLNQPFHLHVSLPCCLPQLQAPGSRLQAPLPKVQPLYPSAKSNLRDRVLGGIEKESFITLPDKGGHTGILPLKTMCPNPAEFNDGIYNIRFTGEVSDKIRV